ncbi:hypothetical protein HPP92_020636 [Vanilla planifolia]|uniref:Uncharacterized protein n=1 Tax=Vanilla planifolia TaxID=51239 RepID=A0A835PYF8_VANPL|nr:hypothetical protein HPP92_021068 [Vanilla planifolia]KAG0462160.1 hypothetical protein HPP92_020636 [Vanilla planifolia]
MVLLCSSFAMVCAFPVETKLSSIPFSASLSSRNKAFKRRVYVVRKLGVCSRVQSFFNPFEDQPIIKEALKEPVAFLGGMFAGILRLDLNEDPLKEWIVKTVEASGVKPEEVLDGEELSLEGVKDSPQQIEIE